MLRSPGILRSGTGGLETYRFSLQGWSPTGFWLQGFELNLIVLFNFLVRDFIKCRLKVMNNFQTFRGKNFILVWQLRHLVKVRQRTILYYFIRGSSFFLFYPMTCPNNILLHTGVTWQDCKKHCSLLYYFEFFFQKS